jgi:hypothetical protein
MAWPSINLLTTHTDESTDSPTQARAQINQCLINVNDILNSRAAADGIPSLDPSGNVPENQLTYALLKTGGTVSGDIILTGGVPTNANGVVPKSYVDAVAPGAGSIGTAQLQDRAVTGIKIALGTVTGGAGGNLAATTIQSNNIADSQITAAKIADGACTVNKLATNSVSNSKIQANAVTTAKIATNAVVYGKIAASAVGSAQLRIGSYARGPFNMTSGPYGGATSSVTYTSLAHYTFASVYANTYGLGAVAVGNIARTGGFHSSVEAHGIVFGATGGGSTTFTFYYITASRNPHMFVQIDAKGRILHVYDDEDPLDEFDPEKVPPLGLNLPIDTNMVRVNLADRGTIETLMRYFDERLRGLPSPEWVAHNPQYNGTAENTIQQLYLKTLRDRAPDLLFDKFKKEDILAIEDDQLRAWMFQLYLRDMSRVLHNHQTANLVDLVSKDLRLDARTGNLEVKG